MMNYRNCLIALFGFFVISAEAQLEASNDLHQTEINNQEKINLPRVFMLGEYETQYEQMASNYEKQLVQIYKEDIDKAFQVWTTVLTNMEDHAKKVSFELNGLKLWINVFFNSDGSIQHIVYYPKPNSRNMAFEQLTNFFISFAKEYQLKDAIPDKCSHFGSASFPSFAKRN